MKNLITMLILVMSVFTSNAQWQPDVRLTNNPSISMSPSISVLNSNIHVVWRDERDGNQEIYYKRSIDGGVTWGSDTRLTNAADYSTYPSVATSGSVVYVVWSDNRDGNEELYYKRSIDSGASWGIDMRLTNNVASSSEPSISASGSNIHVVWMDNRNVRNNIHYKRSTDYGINWSAEIQLANSPGISSDSFVFASGNVLHVVWSDNRDGNYEIYYKLSTDNGITWGVDIRMTNNPHSSMNASVSVSGSTVHLVWSNGQNSGSDIYYKRSTDGGINWGADIRLTNDNYISSYSSLSVNGQAIHIAWVDNRVGNYDIYYKRSTDGGINWGADTNLTSNGGISSFPSISASGSVVRVVWDDTRDGNLEIYYKYTGDLTGIINTNSEIPNQFLLKQNYPNPFNPSTVIRFDVAKTNNIRLVIYNVLAKEVAVLVNEQLIPGTYETNWNASNYASGIYYCQLITNGFTEINKMILIK